MVLGCRESHGFVHEAVIIVETMLPKVVSQDGDDQSTILLVCDSTTEVDFSDQVLKFLEWDLSLSVVLFSSSTDLGEESVRDLEV